ncbi:MAG TPA: hypothetical protein ENF73_03260, partial [Proteobacteria bacterium]|nr:hypothetical protein [Pseudomonadota bacterium]
LKDSYFYNNEVYCDRVLHIGSHYLPHISTIKNVVFYNNLFHIADDPLYIGSAVNIKALLFIVTMSLDPNIAGGLMLGGNYWSKSDGTGFSQTCKDSNSDGFCDEAYAGAPGIHDHFPLVDKSKRNSGAGVGCNRDLKLQM